MDKLLSNTKVYLAGPVERDDDCNSWRDQITPILEELNVLVFNPLSYPKWFKDYCGDVSPEIQRNDKSILNRLVQDDQLDDDYENYEYYVRNDIIRKCCLRLASAADWIICKVSTNTVGTFEEIGIARQQGKPVLFFSNDEDLDSCWRALQFYNGDKIWFNNIDSLISRIKEIDKGELCVNRFEWIFLNNYGWR